MRTSTLVTFPAQLDRLMTPVHALSEVLHGIVSRRGVMRGAGGVLAAALSTRKVGATAAVSARPATCELGQLTPGEACACLCATDATFPLTEERQRQCWAACDVWSGDREFF